MPSESLRTLVNRVIDYAGLFPPAKLDMRAAIENYSRYAASEDSWMLGRFVTPVARLDEFEEASRQALEGLEEGADTWQLAAIAGAASVDDLASDLQRIDEFNLKYDDSGAAVIDVVELKADSPALIEAAMESIPGDLFAFFELPVGRDTRGLIAALANGAAGAKVRTGGMSADGYPSPRHLANFIFNCAAASVPFKATAGLHHPLRHHSDAVNADEFGFLNVFMAGCLALTHELPEAELLELLQERSIEAFIFGDDEAAWRGHRIRTENIQDVREEFAVSFGSCSFDEPREHLRALGLL